ncbi:MAG: hypothetical protein GY928_02180 [Colwellia sp.]|nr:hypothetical protein [Colwellia sp.]
MTIKNAVDHFSWKMKNKRGSTPSPSDKLAMNTIMEFVEDKHKKQINDYHLFAKLYITVYAQYLEKYKTTIFDDIPRKELHKLLDRPVSDFVQRFTDRLNESELYSLFEELNINMDHASKTKEAEIDVLEKSLKDEENLDKFTGKVWTFDTVKEQIELQINNVINAFK